MRLQLLTITLRNYAAEPHYSLELQVQRLPRVRHAIIRERHTIFQILDNAAPRSNLALEPRNLPFLRDQRPVLNIGLDVVGGVQPPAHMTHAKGSAKEGWGELGYAPT